MLFAYSSRDGVENRDKVYCHKYTTISNGGKWLLDYLKVLFPTGLVTVYARTVEVYYW